MEYTDLLVSLKKSELSALLKEINKITGYFFSNQLIIQDPLFFGLINLDGNFKLILPNREKFKNELIDLDCLYKDGIDDIVQVTYDKKTDTLELMWDLKTEKCVIEYLRNGSSKYILYKNRSGSHELPTSQEITSAFRKITSSLALKSA